jgi:hypothetical protein
MTKNDFYQEIEHTPVLWRNYQLYVPLFYHDIMFMNVTFLVPIKRVKTILPSKRMKPYRITPWQTSISITAYQYRKSDLGPYNEVSMGVPITLDTETPLFTGSLLRVPEMPLIYIHKLPVTTEIAREVGAEFAGYPKFIADIEFVENENWITCDLKADNQKVLTFSGRKLVTKNYSRFCSSPITYRRGYILRSEFIISEREMGNSKIKDDMKLEWGEHQIAKELSNLELGKMLGYGYCPHTQGILTPVIESFTG